PTRTSQQRARRCALRLERGWVRNLQRSCVFLLCVGAKAREARRDATRQVQAERAHEWKSCEEKAATRTSQDLLPMVTRHCSGRMNGVKRFHVKFRGTGSRRRPSSTGERVPLNSDVPGRERCSGSRRKQDRC